MAITDIFSTSLLISLAICLLLVGSVFMYFNQKIAEQNHKITSMFDLVSTMAEEVNSVKYHVQMVAGRVGIPLGMQQPTQQPTPTRQPFMNGGISQVNPNTNSNLITISEDEEEDDSDDDESDDDEDDSDEEGDDEDDSDEEGDEEGDDDSDNSDDSDDEEDNEKSEDNNRQDIKIDEDDSDDLDIENLENLNFESVADLPLSEASALNDSDIKNLKKININISSNDNENENDEEEIEIESEDVSDVNIKNVEVLDYKKLSLNKLRSIVTEKGVVTDASKLKKNELLKLLEVE